MVFRLTSGKKDVVYWGNGDDGAAATKKEDKKMKKILIRTHYGKNETTIRISDGRTATRRQYVAALNRCNGGAGDYLERCGDGDDIPVFDGDLVWAII